MRNIIRIFTSDAKRLATNAVAVVMIIGLSVLPCLYAWFNIISNWDPYGESATCNLQVAVASSDLGVDFDGTTLNIGDIVIDNLKQNDTIGWVFCDSAEEAISGVYSGDYYACLVMDEGFSEGMISFLGGEPEHPIIKYYENEKKNAIAPKITSKVKTTVQQEVDKAFVSTMAQVIVQASAYMTTSGSSSDSTLTENTLDRMYDLDDDLTTAITILDSYIAIMDSADSLIDATNEVTDELDTMMDTAQQMANTAESAANSAQNSLDATSDLVTQTLEMINNQLDLVDQQVTALVNQMNGSSSSVNLETVVATLETSVAAQKTSFTSTMVGSVDAATDTATAKTFSNVDSANQAIINTDVTAAYSNYTKLETDLETLKTAAAKSDSDAAAIAKVVSADILACENAINTLSDDYTSKVEPQVSNTVKGITSSLNEVESLLNYSSDAIDDVSDILSTYPNSLNMGKDSLEESKAAVVDMQDMLRDLISDVEELEGNDQYRLLVKLIESDPELVAEFISEPIDLDEEPVYPVANNGSATAPFYIILSVWFGALIIAVIIKAKVKPIPGIDKMKNYQSYFGRYIVVYLIGQLQTIITVMGCLFYVGIQCEKPILFYLACSISSFAFTFFIYSLVYSLGSVGEAAAVVLLVIQVAGAGGTFPVEVLPKVFQVLYAYMPFAYGMNAVRECIGGMHGWDYVTYLSGLGGYILAGLFLGLVVAVPYKKLGNIMEEALEKTGCMG